MALPLAPNHSAERFCYDGLTVNGDSVINPLQTPHLFRL
jgi:hypothetical protein